MSSCILKRDHFCFVALYISGPLMLLHRFVRRVFGCSVPWRRGSGNDIVYKALFLYRLVCLGRWELSLPGAGGCCCPHTSIALAVGTSFVRAHLFPSILRTRWILLFSRILLFSCTVTNKYPTRAFWIVDPRGEREREYIWFGWASLTQGYCFFLYYILVV